MLTYTINKDSMRVKLFDSNIKNSLKPQQAQDIRISLFCSIFVTVPIAFELALDYYLKWKSRACDHGERFLMIAYVVIPSILLLLGMYEYFDAGPYLFACVHMSQYCGCFGAILSICNKIVPEYFTLKRMCLIILFYSLSNILLMLAYGFDHATWRDYLMIISLLISLISFFQIVITWMRTLKIRSFQALKQLSVNDFTCMLYLSTTILTIIIIPSVMGGLYISHNLAYSLPAMLVFTYSMVLFSLISSCIPGRIARYYSMLSESKAIAEREMKWTILRFISHELRSPLNVICTGSTLALEDIELNAPLRRENLSDICAAAKVALGILDDVLCFETIEVENEIVLGTIKPISSSQNLFLKSRGLSKDKHEIRISSQIGCELCDPSSHVGLFLDDQRI